MRKATIDKMERFVSAWGQAESLKDAHELANTGITDIRTMNRFRRKVEKHYNIVLEAHRSEFSTEGKVNCPSTLDMASLAGQTKFVVTSHTNDSTVDKNFLKTLELFSEHHGANLLIKPVRYQNPSAMRSADDYSWDSDIHKYALVEKLYVGGNLVINGEMNIQATAVNPLSGMEEVSSGRNAIYGHPQIAMEAIATPKDEMTRFMHCTGSINAAEYSTTKAGGKARFHHSIGALFVIVVDEFHYPVTLNWNGDGFYYLDEYWTIEGMVQSHTSLALVSGDVHADWEDVELTDRKIDLMEQLGCHTHAYHDLHNQTVGSHHNTPRDCVELALQGKLSVEEELMKSIDYVIRTSRERNVIVGSNHNDHLDQYLDRYTEKKDPINALLVANIKSNMYGSGMSALETFFDMNKQVFEDHGVSYEFSPRDSSYMIGDVDISQHGDDGINGARGSTSGFAKVCRKVIKGHDHTPRIIKGAYGVGFSFLQKLAEYARGFSTWAQADCIIYDDSKRCLIIWGPNSGRDNPHYKILMGED